MTRLRHSFCWSLVYCLTKAAEGLCATKLSVFCSEFISKTVLASATSMSFLLSYIYRLCNTIALQSITCWYKISFPTAYKYKLINVLQNILKFFLLVGLTFQSSCWLHFSQNTYEIYSWWLLPLFFSSRPRTYYTCFIDSVYSSSFVTCLKKSSHGFCFGNSKNCTNKFKEKEKIGEIAMKPDVWLLQESVPLHLGNSQPATDSPPSPFHLQKALNTECGFDLCDSS